MVVEGDVGVDVVKSGALQVLGTLAVVAEKEEDVDVESVATVLVALDGQVIDCVSCSVALKLMVKSC